MRAGHRILTASLSAATHLYLYGRLQRGGVRMAILVAGRGQREEDAQSLRVIEGALHESNSNCLKIESTAQARKRRTSKCGPQQTTMPSAASVQTASRSSCSRRASGQRHPRDVKVACMCVSALLPL